jgi:hypothetical protein
MNVEVFVLVAGSSCNTILLAGIGSQFCGWLAGFIMENSQRNFI